MKKLFIPFLFLSFVVISCSSKEEKAAELIKKELYKTLYDFDSYSPIETIVTEANQSVYTDTAFFESAQTILVGLTIAKEFKENASEAEEKMDIWGEPSYSSSSYSDKQYYKYKEDYDENMGRFLGTWIGLKTLEKKLKDTLQTIDPQNIIGWEVKHKFRCKTKGGYSSIANYRYVIDKNFKNILLYEDMDDDNFEKLRDMIEKVINKGLTTDDL